MSSCALKLLSHLSNGRIMVELTDDRICDCSHLRGNEKADKKEKERERLEIEVDRDN